MDFEKLLNALGASGIAGALKAASEDTRETVLASALVKLEKDLTDLKTRAALGDQWVKSLIEDAVKERVRAVGQGKFNEEKYRVFLANSGDPDFIREEITNYGELAKAALGTADRPTRQAGLKIEGNLDKPEGAKTKRKNPASLYR